MLVGCNIGPHPGHLKTAGTPEEYLRMTRDELQTLVDRLHSHADFFVVNLSSPNTAGLRGLLSDRRLTQEILLVNSRAGKAGLDPADARAIFIAARRRMATCSTSNTRLVVPSPSFRMRRYDPIVRPGASSIA